MLVILLYKNTVNTWFVKLQVTSIITCPCACNLKIGMLQLSQSTRLIYKYYVEYVTMIYTYITYQSLFRQCVSLYINLLCSLC